MLKLQTDVNSDRIASAMEIVATTDIAKAEALSRLADAAMLKFASETDRTRIVKLELECMELAILAKRRKLLKDVESTLK